MSQRVCTWNYSVPSERLGLCLENGHGLGTAHNKPFPTLPGFVPFLLGSPITLHVPYGRSFFLNAGLKDGLGLNVCPCGTEDFIGRKAICLLAGLLFTNGLSTGFLPIQSPAEA